MEVLTNTDVVATDESTAVLLLAAVRRLMRITSEEEVVGVLMDAVRDLGGIVIPAHHRRSSTLAIDLSFGIGEPMLADVSDPAMHSRLRSALQSLVDDASLAIERIALAPEVDPKHATDVLTGLGNWNATMQALSQMVPSDAVALFQLENLKQINDYFGPPTGDLVILSFARTVRRAARIADSVGRVGGTEFVWLLGGSSLVGAESALARLRSMWEQDRPHPVTYAAGLALVGPAGPNEAYMHADIAVQNARNAGTNQTMVGR